MLDPGRQALLTLVYLRKGDTYAALAPGFGVSVATVYRRVNETIDLLASRAEPLPEAPDVSVVVDARPQAAGGASTLVTCDPSRTV